MGISLLCDMRFASKDWLFVKLQSILDLERRGKRGCKAKAT